MLIGSRICMKDDAMGKCYIRIYGAGLSANWGNLTGQKTVILPVKKAGRRSTDLERR